MAATTDRARRLKAPRRDFARVVILALVVVLLLTGLVVRLYDLDDAPLDFHPTRQLHSLIMARGMYFEIAPNVPDWQRERAVQQWRAEGVIEPPILERLAVLTYRMAGREIPHAARVFSILFWLIGAIGLFAVSRELISSQGGLAALGFVLVLPYAVYASRAFQPDPLMAALIVLSWWAFARWARQEGPGWRWALAAGLLGGGALLVKGTAMFLVAGGFAGGLLAQRGLRGALRDARIWLIALLTLLPYGVYTAWGVWGSGMLRDQFGLRFFPQYWLDPAFYLRWFNLLDGAIGLPWLALGALGTFFLSSRLARGLAWGGWAGYLLMGFALSHHISTHDYYSLPLIPLLGFGLAGLLEAARKDLPQPRKLLGTLAVLVLLASAALSAWQARTALKRADYRGEAAFWGSLTEQLGRDAGVVGITQDYGARMVYWGWITPANWLTAAEFDLRRNAGQQFNLAEMFEQLTQGKQFYLVTMLDELERQPEVKELLETRYPLLQAGDGYMIYDLRNPPGGQTDR